MASTINNPGLAESSGPHQAGDALQTPPDNGNSHVEKLRRLIAEGENSGRAQDWALYDFLDRMAEKRRNAGK